MATTTATATAPRRRRSWRWVLATLLVLAVIAGVDAYLSAPRPGTRMDAASTDPDGAHALVALLRDGGVDVVVADHIADVESAARPDALILVAQSQYLADSVLDRLARIRSDLLLVEPTTEARKALLPGVRISGTNGFDSDPNCTLREAVRAGSVRFGRATTFESEDGRAMTRCYDGALIRFRDGGRAITAVGSTDFMTNGSLLQAGNAALAMNLAGGRPRLIWYAPHFVEGESSSKATVLDLIPANVYWVVGQLAVVVLLVAVWR
ncbi:membrane protein, partial [Mycobacterium avium 10-5560]